MKKLPPGICFLCPEPATKLATFKPDDPRLWSGLRQLNVLLCDPCYGTNHSQHEDALDRASAILSHRVASVLNEPQAC